MKTRMPLVWMVALLLAAAPDVGPAALARPGDAQRDARRELRAGEVMRLRDIERRVLPTMAGTQYLGPEYDPTVMAYRLKFIREGRVTFVDVDARTGEVIRESR